MKNLVALSVLNALAMAVRLSKKQIPENFAQSQGSPVVEDISPLGDVPKPSVI